VIATFPLKNFLGLLLIPGEIVIRKDVIVIVEAVLLTATAAVVDVLIVTVVTEEKVRVVIVKAKVEVRVMEVREANLAVEEEDILHDTIVRAHNAPNVLFQLTGKKKQQLQPLLQPR